MISTQIRLLVDTPMKIDAGVAFGPVPKIEWRDKVTLFKTPYNQTAWELNIGLVQVAGKNFLVNTGVGQVIRAAEDERQDAFHTALASRLSTQLKRAGLTPRNIHGVILNSLWWTHAGGCSRFDRQGNIIPAFPNATYYVQRAAYEDACHPNERSKEWYDPANTFGPILEHGQLKMLDGDTEIAPGLSVTQTDGCSRGHQTVTFIHGGEHILFVGDIIPTFHHLTMKAIPAFACDPEKVLEQKRKISKDAVDHGWLLICPHGNDRAGYIEVRDHTQYLRSVAL
jgi:glyoxylase-like metal-dependent hydrolase (beta-lactamase superfamily II)